MVFNNSVITRNILEFCKDNERLFFSHTCVKNRQLVSPWVPSRTVFRTLTAPNVLPSLFSSDGGVFSINIPESYCDLSFLMCMLGHVDLDDRGLYSLKWFNHVRSHRISTDTKRSLVTGFLPRNVLSNNRHYLTLRERMRDNLDKTIVFQTKNKWRLCRSFLDLNFSIDRFVFYRTDSAKICYSDVFRYISLRNSVQYIDISGDMSDDSFGNFGLLFGTLKGVALRNMPESTLDTLLDIISGIDSECFRSLLIQGANFSMSMEILLSSIMNTFTMENLSIFESTFSRNGFIDMLSRSSLCYPTKLSLKKCSLFSGDVISCLFATTIFSSKIKELFISGNHIPESAGSVLYSCVSGNQLHKLKKLSIANCNLGQDCLIALSDGLITSRLTSLNIGSNNLGEASHNIFTNIGGHLKIKSLYIDNCELCAESSVDLEILFQTYKSSNRTILVSMKNLVWTYYPDV